MAVFSEVLVHIADVDPVGAAGVVLPDELVKGQMVADVGEPFLAFLQVSVDAEVCCLTFHVLRVVHAAHLCVELPATEAAADLDGLVHSHAQGFQDIGGQIHQVDNLLRVGLIVDAVLVSLVAGI